MVGLRYKGGYKYQLEDEQIFKINIKTDKDIICEYYELKKEGVLIIKKGYAWDGPSGPTFDTKDFMLGSLIHDVLYQLIGDGLLERTHRHFADKELIKICRLNGMPLFRCFYVYLAVRLFGWMHLNPKEIEEA